jgi:hypothetical protein
MIESGISGKITGYLDPEKIGVPVRSIKIMKIIDLMKTPDLNCK